MSYKNRLKNPINQSLRISLIDNKPLCLICKSKATMIHHLDKNPDNNSLNNLVSICCSCHKKHFHSKYGYETKKSILLEQSEKEITDAELMQEMLNALP